MILLVIDVQKALICDELYNCKPFVNKVSKLIKVARQNEVEIIYVQHDAGQGSGFSYGDEGFEISTQFSPLNDEKVFVKTINSCFGNEEFTNYLKQSGEKTIMIVGLQTDFCIDATIKSAFERGYQVIVPNGTNSTFSNNVIDGKTTYQLFNKWIWPDTFAKCVSMDEALKLLKGKGENQL